MTSDAITDGSSDVESCDEHHSPVRGVKKFVQITKPKPRRKKKMPPELKIIPAPVTFVLNTNCGHDSLLHQYPWPVLTIRSTVSLTAIFCYLKAFCYL